MTAVTMPSAVASLPPTARTAPRRPARARRHDAPRRQQSRVRTSIREPIAKTRLEATLAPSAEARTAGFDQEIGIATVRVTRTEQHRRAERRRLQHRVQAGGVESATDVRHRRKRVEIAEDANAVHDDDVRRSRICRPEARHTQPFAGGPPLDGREMIARWARAAR